MTGGTYTLLVDLATATTVTFGAAGERDLLAGAYAYVGSALGAGGFARLDRHREVAAGERDVRHWHVDYLLGAADASVAGDVRSPGDRECAVAAALRRRLEPIPGIGASDCDCPTHLLYGEDVETVRAAAETAHESV